jgi:putative flippase GtrA
MLKYNAMVQKIWGLRRHSIIRYLVSGASAFIAQYAVLNLTYYMLSLSLHIATSLGYVSGLLVSYTFNRYWVFGGEGKRKHIAYQSVQYGVLVLLNYLFTVWGVSLLKDHGIQPYISPILTTGLIVCWNYILFKKVIFRGRGVETTPY